MAGNQGLEDESAGQQLHNLVQFWTPSTRQVAARDEAEKQVQWNLEPKLRKLDSHLTPLIQGNGQYSTSGWVCHW